jgi:signal transduction histidine kinase
VIERTAFDVLAGSFQQKNRLSEKAAEALYQQGPRYGFEDTRDMREEFGGRCAYCGEVAGDLLEQDHILQTDGAQLEHLVQELVGYAQWQQGPEYTSHDLAQLIADSFLFARAKAEHRGITVHQEFERELPPVWGDRQQLKQVVLKLCLDAIHLTGPGGVMHLITRRTEPLHGCALIFEIVHTKAAVNGPAVSGDIGLGFPIVEEIVRDHGGLLSAEQMADGRRRMAISLPLQ